MLGSGCGQHSCNCKHYHRHCHKSQSSDSLAPPGGGMVLLPDSLSPLGVVGGGGDGALT